MRARAPSLAPRHPPFGADAFSALWAGAEGGLCRLSARDVHQATAPVRDEWVHREKRGWGDFLVLGSPKSRNYTIQYSICIN
jgi:hypothetical protein